MEFRWSQIEIPSSQLNILIKIPSGKDDIAREDALQLLILKVTQLFSKQTQFKLYYYSRQGLHESLTYLWANI